MLTIEVEFLTGVSVAATPYRREEPEWPPHPDRLFQALVAAWGRSDEPEADERAALEWLEALPAETIVVSAPSAHRRDVVTVFVPPNDARTTKDPVKSIRVIPETRKNRQPRAFPAAIPMAEPPLVHYTWPKADGLESHHQALSRLAAEVTYLGHSHTLVRVAVTERGSGAIAPNYAWLGKWPTDLRLPHPARLDHLVGQFERSRTGERLARPDPSLNLTRLKAPQQADTPSTLFDPENVTVLADGGGFVPLLEAFPLVAKRFRDALLKLAPAAASVPALLSGHDADGSPTADPHLAIVPLGDVGWQYAQGRLMGMALVWPREVHANARKAALGAIAAFLRSGSEQAGFLHFGRDGSWRLALDPDAERVSLRFDRYIQEARRWGTVMPAVLDRHPKEKPGEELAAVIAQACINAGLPPEAVQDLDIEVHKYAPVKGGPSVRDVHAALAQESPYRNRPMMHLVLTFAQAVRGPLIIGAGRFRGLGLCLPLSNRDAA